MKNTVYRGMLSDFLAIDEEYSDEDYYKIGKEYYKNNKDKRDFEYYKVELGNYETIDYEELGRDIVESLVKE